MRPCAPDSGAVKATDGGGKATDGGGKATDEAGRGGYADRPPGFLPLTCHFRMPARCRQQDRDPVPGPAGHLGRRHPGVQPQRDGGVAQVVGAVAERRPALGRGESLLAGLAPHGAVGRVLDDAAPGGLEDPPVLGVSSSSATGSEARSALSRAAATFPDGTCSRVAG